MLRRGFVDDERTAQMCEDGWLNLSVIPLSLNMNITHLYDIIIDEMRMIVKSIIKGDSYNFCLGLV